MGELFLGSIGFHSPSGTSSGSNASPDPGMVAVIRVRPDGPMQLTVTPDRYSSCATVSVIPTIAAFAVAYPDCPKLPPRPAPEVVLMMRPCTSSPDFARSRKWRAAKCDVDHVPRTCTAMTASQSATGMFQMAA